MYADLGSPVAQALMARAEGAFRDLVDEVIAICEIPAPTFHEQQRAAYVEQRMTDLGLEGVHRDPAGNVVGRKSGTGGGPTVLVAAHLDTVFPPETDVKVRVDGEILRAPGIGDNSASVATMLKGIQVLGEAGVSLPGDLIFAANVGEEGLGDLVGIRTLMERLKGEVDYVLILDGSLGGMVREGVGSRRFRLEVTTEGGHSWGAFGVPSAIHSLGRIIAEISDIRVPANPRTTYNVGTISGGTTVNTIAAHAEALIDLRSVDQGELRRLEERLRRIVQVVAHQTGVDCRLVLLGDRPSGSLEAEHPLCRLVRTVHQQLEVPTRVYPSSTDANMPLAMGIPAVTVGVTLGGNGHRTDEYIHTRPLMKGLQQLLLLLLGIQQLAPRLR